ncbi:MAG: UPF0182 family protein, partial [Chloroflexota bacterium]
MTFYSDLDRLWSQSGQSKAKPAQDSGRRDRRRGRLAIIAALAVLLIAASLGKGFYTEWLWFGSLDFGSIYTTVLATRVWLFLAGALAFLVFLVGNLLLARRLSPVSGVSVSLGQGLVLVRRVVDLGILAAALFLTLIFGLVTSGQWEMVLRFSHAQGFGVSDPLLGRDVAFYVFNLPFYHFLQGWWLWAVVLSLIFSAAIYGLNLGFSRSALTTAVRGHLSGLGAVIFGLIAWGYRLSIFDLVYAKRGVVFGAGYTDVHAQWPAWRIMMVVAAIAGLLLLFNVFRRVLRMPLYSLGLWVVAAILVGSVYPALVQRFQVEPSELARETPYIENNISMTRLAFGLDSIAESSVPVETAPTAADVAANEATINNIRLWDYRPLKDTYNQIQSIRLYYDFTDADVDRYTLDGDYRQVMLGAREIFPERLDVQAQTWVTRHLQFTHGYGVAMSPVNEVTAEGLPELWIKDIPPVGKISVTRPEIYYGERTNDYVIVNSNEEEFDYPKGDANVYTEYTGTSGVRLDSFLRRLAYAWEFGDINILISGEMTGRSQLLYRRHIQQRVQHIAPFLKLDGDPYIVVDGGQLFWIQDAYTVTDRYPYSQPVAAGINYIRNSVKVVTSAYEGSVTFYLMDPDDALARTYQAIFPALFTPIDRMPASLRAHLRYPLDLFQIQSTMYQTYHMQDPRVFYNKEDLWAIPSETYVNAEQAVEPYYVIMKLPGETQEEFLLILPFTPARKDNMITWLAARSDGERYGSLIAYNFPKDKLVYGPRQIEARIDQDPTISSQFTLWGQQGSQIIRGNLL